MSQSEKPAEFKFGESILAVYIAAFVASGFIYAMLSESHPWLPFDDSHGFFRADVAVGWIVSAFIITVLVKFTGEWLLNRVLAFHNGREARLRSTREPIICTDCGFQKCRCVADYEKAYSAMLTADNHHGPERKR